MIKTEAKAWREVARRIAEGEWGSSGICSVLGEMRDDRDITEPRRGDMQHRMLNYGFPDPASEYFPFILPEGDTARVLVCLWLALDAETEDNA